MKTNIIIGETGHGKNRCVDYLLIRALINGYKVKIGKVMKNDERE